MGSLPCPARPVPWRVAFFLRRAGGDPRAFVSTRSASPLLGGVLLEVQLNPTTFVRFPGAQNFYHPTTPRWGSSGGSASAAAAAAARPAPSASAAAPSPRRSRSAPAGTPRCRTAGHLCDSQKNSHTAVSEPFVRSSMPRTEISSSRGRDPPDTLVSRSVVVLFTCT